jgi:molybdopterin-guanine dinucleotide biosynthesis protein A
MKAPIGIILAGGEATRMGGGDKGLLPLGDSRIIDHVIARFEPQCDSLALNANGDPARFADLALPIIADSLTDSGPLAGVLAGLDHAADRGATHIVTVAADTPFLPCDLVPQLLFAAETSGVALAASPSGRHPTFGLWPVSLADDLRWALGDGMRKVAAWADLHDAGTATFPDDTAFFNVNTPDDLVRAGRLL